MFSGLFLTTQTIFFSADSGSFGLLPEFDENMMLTHSLQLFREHISTAVESSGGMLYITLWCLVPMQLLGNENSMNIPPSALLPPDQVEHCHLSGFREYFFTYIGGDVAENKSPKYEVVTCRDWQTRRPFFRTSRLTNYKKPRVYEGLDLSNFYNYFLANRLQYVLKWINPRPLDKLWLNVEHPACQALHSKDNDKRRETREAGGPNIRPTCMVRVWMCVLVTWSGHGWAWL